MKKIVFRIQMAILLLFSMCLKAQINVTTASPTITYNGVPVTRPAHIYTWKDATNNSRSAVMVDQRVNGCGYLAKFTYKVGGVDRVCQGTGANGAETYGDGFVQNHTGNGGDFESTNVGGTNTFPLQGTHHSIIQFNMPTYTISDPVNGGGNVPTTIQWFFATGRDYPIYSLTQDARARTGNIAGDSRSPYGDMHYDGFTGASPWGGDKIGGVSMGDTKKWVSVVNGTTNESTFLTTNSGWNYSEANTIPYVSEWTQNINAEQGHVQTLPISIRDAGRRDPGAAMLSSQQLNGPMLTDEQWMYQSVAYGGIGTSGGTSKRLTWGTNFGAIGGFDDWWLAPGTTIKEYTKHSDGLRTIGNGGMFLAYSVFDVFGTHTGGYKNGSVGKMVKQMENMQAASLMASVGNVVTSGPAGVQGSGAGFATVPTVTYTPAGYNSIYATWELTASNDLATASLTPAAGKPIETPIFVINNYNAASISQIRIDGNLGVQNVDFFASLDTTAHKLWITVNKTASTALTIEVGNVSNNAPVANAQTLCEGTTVSNLVATGESLKWYNVANGGAALATNVVLATGTYYVSQTVGAIESARTLVSVTVNPNITYYADTDGDGYGYLANTQTSCSGAPTGFVVNSTDCNDTDANVHPGVEICGDGIDNNCDGIIDEGCAPVVQSTLQVVGKNLTQIGGQSVILRGLNYHILDDGATSLSNPSQYQARIDQVALTGANCVRIPWQTDGDNWRDNPNPPANGTPGTVNGYVQNGHLNNIISYIISKGMIPVLDIHDNAITCGTDWNYFNTTVMNFWTSPAILSLIENNKSKLIINLANEFDKVRWSGGNDVAALNNFKTQYNAAIANMRAHGVNVPIMIDAPDCGQSSTELLSVSESMNASDSKHNLIFSAHAYWSDYASTPSQISAKLNEALNKNVCFIFGEIAKKDNVAGCGDTDITAIYQQILTESCPKNIGWLAWTFNNDCVADRDISTTYMANNLTVFGNDIINNTVYGLKSEGGCGNGIPVVLPANPTSNPQTFCVGATVNSLLAVGTLLKWYNTAVGGTALATNVVLLSGNYYVTQTIDGTESARTTVAVTIDSNCSQIIPTSKVKANQCGTTLTSLSDNINADYVAGYQQYRFEVTNGATVNTVDVNKYNFSLTKTPGITYGTTYGVRVAVKIGGTWGAYGSSCNVTTPAPIVNVIPTTKILPAFCGTTLATLDTKIGALPIIVATGYRFEITSGGVSTIYDSAVYNFKLSQSGAIVASSTTYSIRVAVLVNGIYGNYGTSCNIITPTLTNNVVPITKILPAFCGTTLATLDTKIGTTPVYSATGYRFEIASGGISSVYDSTVYNFKLSQTGVFVDYNTAYSIRVAAFVGGVWGNYGSACTVTTPVAPGVRLKSKTFEVSAYPNPFDSAFNLNLETPSKEEVTIAVYDMMGKLVETHQISPLDIANLQLGNNFSIGIYNVIVSQGDNTKVVRLIRE